MRKITLLCLSLLMTGIAAADNTDSKTAERFKRMNDMGRTRMAVPGMNNRTAKAFQLEKAGFAAGPEMSPKRAADEAGDKPVSALTATYYGMIYGKDGDTWFYTQETEVNEYYYYTSSQITIYDSHHNEAGHISYTCPEGKKVNAIMPFGQITTKMFDNNSNTQEVAVFIHYVEGPGETIDSTFIYNLQGEVVLKYEGQIADVFDIQNGQWSSSQRAILQRQVIEEGEDYYLYFDVLKPAGYSGTPEVEHTFKINSLLTNYSDEGPCFSVCDVDGEPYYVLSHYEQSFVEGIDLNTFELIIRENNDYVIDVYDKNYERVDSFGVKLEKPDDALYRMAAFSMFSDNDMSRNYFTSTGEINYVVTIYDYLTSSDSYRYSFNVYNNKGELQKTICDNVTDVWFRLSDLKGHDEQWAFLQTIGTTQQIQMVNLPSCEKATLIPSEIEGESITTTLDRYPKDDSYQYAISLAYADSDNDGNVLSRIGWYNTDLTLDRYVTFNLGPSGQYFTPQLTNESLDPYLFDTDDEHEYPFLAKIKRTDSSVIDNVIVIGNEDGSVLREFRGDDENFIWAGGILGYGTDNQEFYIVTRTGQTSTDLSTLEFYSLPFKKFAAGGEGTAENPYLIATLGDMQQMKAAPNAHYRMIADIDMAGYPTAWSSVANFTGTLDGDGHTLSNFTISSDEYRTGLFGELGADSKVKNLVILNPELEVNGNNSYAGIIAGQATTDSITGVHIYGARIHGDNEAAVGGIVGQAMLYSGISDCSFDGVIDMAKSEYAGGIAGNTRTSTDIRSCSVTGTITGTGPLGGIVGATGSDSKVYDCHADVTLKADNTVGGIVGSNDSRAPISHCYATGSIEVTKAGWNGLSAGGITGYLEPEWSDVQDIIVSGCVSAADIIIPVSGKDDKTVNRIVGRTIVNESYEPGETVRTEIGLADNYALETVTVGGRKVTSDDATSTDGATKGKAETDTDFFLSLGYEYGTTTESPWKAAPEMPVLWFENVAMGLTFSSSNIRITEGETADVTVTVYGTDADNIELSASDDDIIGYEIVGEDGNTMTVRIECKKAGTATITASAGNLTAECVVNGVVSGIDTVNRDAADMTIRPGADRIEAAGASRITLYNTAGQLAARTAGSVINTANMAKGVYVVVAADANGRTTTGKVVVK